MTSRLCIVYLFFFHFYPYFYSASNNIWSHVFKFRVSLLSLRLWKVSTRHIMYLGIKTRTVKYIILFCFILLQQRDYRVWRVINKPKTIQTETAYTAVLGIGTIHIREICTYTTQITMR